MPLRISLLAIFSCAALAQPAPYPPPGRMIDLGGYRVHLYCAGQPAGMESNPSTRLTVMIVGAGYSFDWSLVQPEIAKHTRICAWDAPGRAWSDAAPASSGCAQRVEEIHGLLTEAEIKPPYILTGLSAGALIARLYTSMYRPDVAGLVLVDHAFLPSAPAPPPQSVPGLDSPPILISKTPIHLTVEDTSSFAKLSPRAQELHRWADSRHPALPTVEFAQDCLAELARRDPPEYPLGNLPLAVISTTNDLPEYKKLQTQLLALSRVREAYVAQHSVHSVEIDDPEEIDAAIERMLGGLQGH